MILPAGTFSQFVKFFKVSKFSRTNFAIEPSEKFSKFRGPKLNSLDYFSLRVWKV